MIFAQQNINRNRYFKQRYGQWHNIPLELLPHYEFVRGDIEPYKEYIGQSWQTNDKTVINNQVAKFSNLIRDIQKNGVTEKPILHELKDRNKLIIDGNHRLSVAAALNISYAYSMFSMDDFLNFQPIGQSRYDKNEKGFYQSFYINGSFYKGRRSNQVWQFINQYDIENKIVLDLGCNIGANSYYAKQNGANRVIGLDFYDEILTFACRLNNFYQLPDVDFEQYDLNKVYKCKADTIFCFSMESHIKNTKALVETLKQAKVIYFETDETGESGLIKEFKPEYVGNTDNGIHSREKNRKVYRLT